MNFSRNTPLIARSLFFAAIATVAFNMFGQTRDLETVAQRAQILPAFLVIAPPLLKSTQAAESSSTARPSNNPIPDRFTNLQVLPKDISKPKLVGLMKQFSITFKVRCMYCHAVSDDLTVGSFSSDEKDSKVKARELLKTMREISSGVVPKAGSYLPVPAPGGEDAHW